MKLEQIETWRAIAAYEGLYEVSDLGNIRAIKRSGSKGLSLKVHKSKGYLQVWLSKSNKVKKFSAHRLVALAFIPNSENKPEVNHKDGNKINNHITNLEWVTKAENEAHKKGVLGHTGIGEKNANFGHRKAKLYPNEELRNKLCALGIPRYKHNLAELGQMLPLYVGNAAQFHVVFNHDHHGWLVDYVDPRENVEYEETADTEADARAKMLCYLVENKLIGGSNDGK